MINVLGGVGAVAALGSNLLFWRIAAVSSAEGRLVGICRWGMAMSAIAAMTALAVAIAA